MVGKRLQCDLSEYKPISLAIKQLQQKILTITYYTKLNLDPVEFSKKFDKKG